MLGTDSSRSDQTRPCTSKVMPRDANPHASQAISACMVRGQHPSALPSLRNLERFSGQLHLEAIDVSFDDVCTLGIEVKGMIEASKGFVLPP